MDTVYGEYAEFTMHIPVVLEEEESEEDEDAPVGMAVIVERMSAEN